MDRLWLFAIPLVVLILLELAAPRRQLILPRSIRWLSAGVLVAMGAVISRLLVPVGLVGVAIWAGSNGIGLMNWIDLPYALIFAVSLILFDLAIWSQHVAMHRVDFLWRFHRVHHSDPDFDVFTALRFHPGELVLSLGWKAVVVVTLGLPPLAVFWSEVLLSLGALFSHANLKLPQSLDRVLRVTLVTPDMHRVHHSTDFVESNRNFGFCLPWWDRLFGLYQSQPAAGHGAMNIGQSSWRSERDQALAALLVQPGKRPAD